MENIFECPKCGKLSTEQKWYDSTFKVYNKFPLNHFSIYYCPCCHEPSSYAEISAPSYLK